MVFRVRKQTMKFLETVILSQTVRTEVGHFRFLFFLSFIMILINLSINILFKILGTCTFKI